MKTLLMMVLAGLLCGCEKRPGEVIEEPQVTAAEKESIAETERLEREYETAISALRGVLEMQQNSEEIWAENMEDPINDAALRLTLAKYREARESSRKTKLYIKQMEDERDMVLAKKQGQVVPATDAR